MTKKEKAEIISEYLDNLYPTQEIPLKFRNPFTFLIAVLLSAQCTDKRVNEVTPALFDLADNPKDMAKLPVEKIQEIIRPCGLSKNKANNISKLSKTLLEKFGGEVPQNMKAVSYTHLTLPTTHIV